MKTVAILVALATPCISHAMCYMVYSSPTSLVYQSETAPIEMATMSITDEVKKKFPNSSIMISHATTCPPFDLVKQQEHDRAEQLAFARQQKQREAQGTTMSVISRQEESARIANRSGIASNTQSPPQNTSAGQDRWGDIAYANRQRQLSSGNSAQDAALEAARAILQKPAPDCPILPGDSFSNGTFECRVAQKYHQRDVQNATDLLAISAGASRPQRRQSPEVLRATNGEVLTPSGNDYSGSYGNYYVGAGTDGVINTATGQFSPITR